MALLLALAPPLAAGGEEGIRFACPPARLAQVESDMADYLAALGIGPSRVVKRLDRAAGTLVYTLNTPPADTNTLTLSERPELAVAEEVVALPAGKGRVRRVHTVSRKEIVLALLQHGRLTELKGEACNLAVLRDHVALRQNTVAWAETLEWHWPDGGPARWHGRFWRRGTPRPGVALADALNDVFFNPGRYGIGCYTATKLVVVQGAMDYYRRVAPHAARQQLVEARLAADGDPLVDIEPGAVWDFEPDFDPRDSRRPGKLATLMAGVAPENFVPGDWVVFVNPDPATYGKTGYEGSNTIYLGRDRFADFYNDHHHGYSFRQKLDQVYQWRHGVFSRNRDAARAKPLAAADFQRLARAPADGGLLLPLRLVPYLFGAEELPPLPSR